MTVLLCPLLMLCRAFSPRIRRCAAVAAALGGVTLPAAVPARAALAQPAVLDFATSPSEVLGERCAYEGVPFPSTPEFGSVAGRLDILYFGRGQFGLTDPPNYAGCSDVFRENTGQFSGLPGMAYSSAWAAAIRLTPIGGNTLTLDSFLTGLFTGGRTDQPDQVRIYDVATGDLLWGQDQFYTTTGPLSWHPAFTATGPVELQWRNADAPYVGLAQVAYTLNAPSATVPEPSTAALVAAGGLLLRAVSVTAGRRRAWRTRG